MTESEWVNCNEPDRMLDFLLDRTTERKFRLFACACVRRHADLLKEYKWSGKALEAVERFIDGHLTQDKMNRAASKFDAAVEEEDLDEPADSVSTALWHLMNACKAIEGAAWAKSKAAAHCMAIAAAGKERDAGSSSWEADRNAEVQAQVRLLHCIVNPFHAVTLTPSPTVVRLAQAAYDERLSSGELDPRQLAVLADALEEAGAGGDLLSHLRGPEAHVRGCWAVDAVLGEAGLADLGQVAASRTTSPKTSKTPRTQRKRKETGR
jgi:hypothetical protein